MTLWAIGQRTFRMWNPFGNIIVRSTDGGQVWDTVMVNFPGEVSDIEFVTPGKGWYLGDSASIIGTSDGGLIWNTVYDGSALSAQPLNDLFSLQSDHVWSVGHDGLFVRSTDGGGTWEHTVIDSSVDIQSVFFADVDAGWCGGDHGELWETTDGGASWTKQSSGDIVEFQAAEFVTPQLGWAVTSYGSNQPGGIYLSRDHGLSWDLQFGVADGSFVDVEMVDSLLGWVIGSMPGDDHLLKTTNGGITWEPVTNVLVSTFAQGVFFLDQDHGWIYGEDDEVTNNQFIRRTTDGGETWSVSFVDTSFAGFPSITDLQFIDQFQGWCINQSGVFESTDGGITWQHIYSDLTVFYKSSLAFADHLNGWFCGLKSTEGGVIYHTTDGGITWVQQISDIEGQLEKIRFASPEKGWAVGLGSLLHTDDGGATWIVDTPVIDPRMLDVTYLVEDNVVFSWAVGMSGSVFLHESSLTSVKGPVDSGIPQQFSLHQSYPNPFNGISNFEFAISNLTDVSLTIYDVLGRQVATLVNDRLAPGTYRRQWDATGQPSGVYFYRLKAGSYIETKKLVLLR